MYVKLVFITALLLGSQVTAAGPDRRTSLDEAVSDAREHYHGRVLSAETRQQNGRNTHNIRILTGDGHVRRYRVDADAERPPRGRQPNLRRPNRR